MAKQLTLDMLLPNESGTVLYIKTESNIKKRLQDIGVIEKTKIKCVGKSPLGDPKAYLIRGSIIAIRDIDAQGIIIEKYEESILRSDRTVLLAGNPNVGKSTLFNALTGMKQHTGNWTGKTVSSAKGEFQTDLCNYTLIDLPGTYSLEPHSAEEEVTRNCIYGSDYDAVIIVCDATNLEHGLYLVLQILKITERVVICVNLMDEAKQRGIEINIEKLSISLGVAVVGVTARDKKSLSKFSGTLDTLISKMPDNSKHISTEIPLESVDSEILIQRAEEIASECITDNGRGRIFSQADKILTSKTFGYPIMLILLSVLFWITVSGANYPSKLLSGALSSVGDFLRNALLFIHLPDIVVSVLIDGIYNMTARVVSVMLPPMAIFFPLFTILEDLGYLPRVAFNLDKPFNKCQACGKQALTMCMGFGCNACGVTGARIIDSPRERLLAIITNSFVPCNGKFPTIIAIISMFIIGMSNGLISGMLSALALTAVIITGVILTFVATNLLSRTLLKGERSAYTLELPPFRRPQIVNVTVRSILDRTVFVLGRAVAAAAPAGLLVWIAANVYLGEISILSHCANFFDPLARIFGLDGVILISFILGIAANETVIPIMIMSYLSLGSPFEFSDLSVLHELLVSNGWTTVTAVCTIIFSLLHWPCATTLITVKKETGSIKWTLISALLPTLFGLVICFTIATFARILR